jgi:single-strand DNA-binding protein
LEMWDKQAETAEKYLKKGSLLYVEGKIRTDRYTDAEGQERQTRKIRVNNFQMMGSLLASRSEEGSRSDAQGDTNATDGGHAMDTDQEDEGLPF